MVNVWPGSLPQYAETDGLSEKDAPNAVRTAMETGPAKLRRRYTAVFTPIKATLIVDATQRATLKDFFRNTCKGGSQSFDWLHPMTREAATFRWVSPPEFTPLSGGGAGLALLRASLDLEIMP